MQRRVLCPTFLNLLFASISLGQTPGTTQRSNHDYQLLNSHIITQKGVVHKNNRYLLGPKKGNQHQTRAKFR